MERYRDTAERFSRQAEVYAASPGHAHDSDLDVLAAFANPGLYDFCIDIATGPGHTAFRIASRAAMVIALDIAPGMLETGRRLAAERGVTNVSFQEGSAESIPFDTGTFDLATCRIAPHHFHDVSRFLREVRRVLKPAGRFVMEDNLAPDEPEVAEFLDQLERRRDPTHVRSLSHEEWRKAFKDAGFRITRETVFPKNQDFALWVTRTGLDASEIDVIEQMVADAPQGIRERLFSFAADRPSLLHDRKLILHAEHLHQRAEGWPVEL